MKDPEKEMVFITGYEKLIVGNKIRLDTSRDKHKWSCNTYHCLVELVGSKVKCHCPQCEIVRHQINIQLRLVFTWTNQFHHEDAQCEDAVWKMCEGIFFLIEQSHSNFTKNICNEVDAFDCTPKLLSKGKGKEANTEGPGSECIPAPAPAV
jgi:hypothetical protein